MEKVEADLTRSKSLREKQTKEFGHQLEELQQKYEQQVSPGPEWVQARWVPVDLNLSILATEKKPIVLI